MFKTQHIINTRNQMDLHIQPELIVLTIPNLEINKSNKNNRYNISEINKRINNTYYLKIIGLN
jgi:hypothetical protein